MLEYLRLGSSEDELWAATGKKPEQKNMKRKGGGEITVLRRVDGVWSQVFGNGEAPKKSSPNRLPALFEADPDVVKSQQEEEELLGSEGDSQAEVEAIAPEPETEDARIALAKHLPLNSTKPKKSPCSCTYRRSGSVLGVEPLPAQPRTGTPREQRPRRRRCGSARLPGARRLLDGERERLALPFRARR